MRAMEGLIQTIELPSLAVEPLTLDITVVTSKYLLFSTKETKVHMEVMEFQVAMERLNSLMEPPTRVTGLVPTVVELVTWVTEPPARAVTERSVRWSSRR